MFSFNVFRWKKLRRSANFFVATQNAIKCVFLGQAFVRKKPISLSAINHTLPSQPRRITNFQNLNPVFNPFIPRSDIEAFQKEVPLRIHNLSSLLLHHVSTNNVPWYYLGRGSSSLDRMKAPSFYLMEARTQIKGYAFKREPLLEYFYLIRRHNPPPFSI